MLQDDLLVVNKQAGNKGSEEGEGGLREDLRGEEPAEEEPVVRPSKERGRTRKNVVHAFQATGRRRFASYATSNGKNKK